MFRFANIIGSRSRHGVIYDFVNKLTDNPDELEILGDGSQERPFIHVSECVDGILHGFRHSDERLNLFNIGVESSTDVTALARIVAREMGLTGVRLKYTGGIRGWRGDAPQVRFDMSRMRAIGWEARLSSDESIEKATREIVREMRLCRL